MSPWCNGWPWLFLTQISHKVTLSSISNESAKSSIQALHYCKMIFKLFKKSKLSLINGIIRDKKKYIHLIYGCEDQSNIFPQNLPLPSCLPYSVSQQVSQFLVLVMAVHHYQFSQHYHCSWRLVSLHKQLKTEISAGSTCITRTKSLDPLQLDGIKPKTCIKFVHIIGFPNFPIIPYGINLP